MYPHETWSNRIGVEPRLRPLNNIYSTTFQAPPPRFLRRVLRKIVVEIESAINSWRQAPAVENHGADKRRRMVSLLLQQLCPGCMRASKRNRKIRDPM